MKRRSDKLKKVVTLAATEEREFGAATGRSQQLLSEQQDRLGELNAFRQSYAERDVGEVSAMQLKDYHSFLSRLDTAVKTQQQIVNDCEQNLEVQRQRWTVKRQKRESLERVLEKSREREAVFQERLQQKLMDDLVRPRDPHKD
ncbi:MAG: flagellar export protein FliJ [Pseudomonadota bacterium]